MLAFNALIRRHTQTDDAGVAMAMVVASWAIGLIAVTVILATVMFATQSNVDNKSGTQAFASAESGRDLMLQSYLAGCALDLTDSNSSPKYEDVRVVSSGTSQANQHSPATCASETDNTVFVIESTGVGDDGALRKVTTTYSRNVTYDNRPGGSLSYMAGSFTIVQSQYSGDVVIRDNAAAPWDCNSHGEIDGDLWVLNGSVNIQSTCKIVGNIYAFGYVNIKAANTIVTGKIVAKGYVDLSGGNGITVGTGLPANSDAIVSGSYVKVGKNKVTGNVRAAGAITVDAQGSVSGTRTTPIDPATVTFNPTLNDVYAMTNWMDIGSSRALWGTDVKWETPSSCAANVTSAVTESLAAQYTRVGVDYSACAGSKVTINLGAAAVKHDTVFLVPPTSPMDVELGGTLSSAVSPTAQLFFVHSDPNLTNSAPNCGTGVATDDISPPSVSSVHLMFYTACGVGKHTGNMNPFAGQYYAANPTNSATWVQPTFTCKAMQWTPLINLGCTVGAADSNNDGTVETTIQPPSLVTQTEPQ